MHGTGNLLFLLLVVIAALVLFGFVCPWLDQIGHKWLCYVAYAVLVVLLLYTRESTRRSQTR